MRRNGWVGFTHMGCVHLDMCFLPSELPTTVSSIINRGSVVIIVLYFDNRRLHNCKYLKKMFLRDLILMTKLIKSEKDTAQKSQRPSQFPLLTIIWIFCPVYLVWIVHFPNRSKFWQSYCFIHSYELCAAYHTNFVFFTKNNKEIKNKMAARTGTAASLATTQLNWRPSETIWLSQFHQSWNLHSEDSGSWGQRSGAAE